MSSIERLSSQFLDPLNHRPILYDCASEEDMKRMNLELSDNPNWLIRDNLEGMMLEWMKLQSPHEKPSKEVLEKRVGDFFSRNDKAKFGCWVAYPWRQTLVRIPSREIFIGLRTSRNQYKITPSEQKALAEKVVGVVGLSVGQSVALTLAMERVGGILKLADFDELDLSNLNRIRSGIFNVSLPKCTIAAREIAEIDPFIRVETFLEGITSENIQDFLGGEQPLDLLIEECDSLPIKVLLREKARERRLPVIMDTSDRGMLDIERFDLEPERPLLHGIIPGLGSELIQGLPEHQRVPMMLQLVGGAEISPRMKASMLQVGTTLTTWPQLASSIMLGGGVAADAARRILLNEPVRSGRSYFDTATLLDKNSAPQPSKGIGNNEMRFPEVTLLRSGNLLQNREITFLKGIERAIGDPVLDDKRPEGLQFLDLSDEDLKWIKTLHGQWLRDDLLLPDGQSRSWEMIHNGVSPLSIGISPQFVPHLGLLMDQEVRMTLKKEDLGQVFTASSGIPSGEKQVKIFLFGTRDDNMIHKMGIYIGEFCKNEGFALLPGGMNIIKKSKELFTNGSGIKTNFPSETAKELFTLMQKLEQEHIITGVLVSKGKKAS